MHFAEQQRAKLLLDMGRPKDALRHLVELLRSDPDDHYAHYLSAYAHIQLNTHTAAFTHLRAALAGAPEQPAYQLLLANLQSLTGEHRAGLEVINNALKNAPENADLHSTHGALLMRMSRFEEADIALKRALELNPDHINALQLGAFNADVLQSKEKAQVLIQTAARQDPAHARTLAGIAWNDFLLGNPGDHAAGFRSALSKDPQEGLARLGSRLSTAWSPRYQAWAQRMALKVQVQNSTSTAGAQLISTLLLGSMFACWAYSGWRWDMGLCMPLSIPAVPFLVLIGLPTLLQAPHFFSAEGRALFKEEPFARTLCVALLTLTALAFLTIDLVTEHQLILHAIGCLIAAIIVNKVRRERKTARQFIGIALMLTGSTTMAYAALVVEHEAMRMIVLVVGTLCAVTSYIFLAEEMSQ